MPTRKPKVEKSEFDKLPVHIRRLIDRCRSGAVLCMTFRERDIGDPVCYFEPGGKRVSHRTAMRAISTPYMRPGCDGLFGPDNSQTWTAA